MIDKTLFTTTEVIPVASATPIPRDRLTAALEAPYPNMTKRGLLWTMFRTLYGDVKGGEVHKAIVFTNTFNAGANMHNDPGHPIQMSDSLNTHFAVYRRTHVD